MAVRRLVLLAALMACLTLAGPAWAGDITFSGSTPQGELTFNGIGSMLSIGSGFGGSGGPIDLVMSQFATCNPSCPITNGFLSLMAGPAIAGGSPGIWLFGAGTISIMGTIPGFGSSLLTANITSATFDLFHGGPSAFTATLSSVVLDAGFGTLQTLGGNALALTILVNANCENTGVGCAGQVLSDSVTVNANAIPEPATLSVLGVGLLAFGAGLRRRALAP